MATPTTALTPESVQSMLNGPAGTPPLGVTPNFENPSNMNTMIITTLVFCVGLASLAVLVRMYTKLFLIRSLAYEDYALMIAWVGQIGQTIPAVMNTRYGVGVHIWNLRLKTFSRILYLTNVVEVVYCPILFFVKLSILLQYLRIFCPTRQKNTLYVGVHICIWTIFVFYFVVMFLEIFACTPREKIWNSLMTTGHCLDNNANFQASGIFNVLSDFTILILPIPSVCRLKVPLKKKLGIISVFSAGFLACVTSIVRTAYTRKIIDSEDFTYNICLMGLWTFAEISIGIIVACLPLVPRFFQFVSSKMAGSFSFRSSTESKIELKPNPTGLNDSIKVPTKSSASGSRNDPYAHRVQLKGGYNILDEIGSTSAERGLTCESAPHTRWQTDYMHNTLESGHQGIRVDRTTQIELGPNTACGTVEGGGLVKVGTTSFQLISTSMIFVGDQNLRA